VSDELVNGWWTASEALRRNPQLASAELVWRGYSAPAPDWDHDHCVLCMTKITEIASEDVLDAAYTHDRPTLAPKG